MTRAAERLAEQFADLPLATVGRVVGECAADCAQGDPAEVERVARAVLATLSGRSERVEGS